MDPSPADACVLACDAFVDGDVVDAGGLALGRIAHIVLDVSRGRIAYAVLASGGVFGIGERLFAVPWDALAFDPDTGALVLASPQRHLDPHSEFAIGSWPGV